MSRRALAVFAIAALGSACGESSRPRGVRICIEPGSRLDLRALRVSPAGAARFAEPNAGCVELVSTATGPLEIDHPEACPLRIDRERGARTVQLRPILAIDDLGQVGFDSSFRLVARVGCELAGTGPISWKQIEGPPVRELEVEGRGFAIRGKTHRLAELRAEPVPWGIVPLSARTQGRYRFELSWVGAGRSLRRSALVTAAARASGLPSVAPGQRLFLGGDGWTVIKRPDTSAGAPVAAGGIASFTPDLPGRWVLADGSGSELSLEARRHDETPLDCGRAECHPNETAAARDTRMTTVLRRGLDGALAADYDPRCAIACHSAGEPGLSDGGFGAVAREIGFELPAAGAADSWPHVPRALRRLGGVTCTACHGPGAIPLPEARWTQLRSDVCAVCHDLPPAYGHVAGWRQSAMARADATPAARRAPCDRCHTTAGFLASLGQRGWAPMPEVAGSIGLACATCHAVHGAHGAGTPLVRQPPVPALLAGAAGVPNGSALICLPCHTPDPVGSPPASSAAAIWLGRGGVGAAGQPLRGSAVHARVVGGCLGCHRAGPDGASKAGAGHAFAVDWSACRGCHGATRPVEIASDGRTIAERARVLADRLGVSAKPPHAGQASADSGPRMQNLLLLLEDPAAASHNAAYARELLDVIEAL